MGLNLAAPSRIGVGPHWAEFAERASSLEWIQTLLLAANLIWTTLSLGGYRPETMLTTAVMTAALGVVHFARAAFTQSTRPASHGAIWMVPFLVYAAVNVVTVSPVPWLGWMDWFGWVNLIAIFWIVQCDLKSTWPRRVIFLTLIALGVVAVAMGCYQRFVDGGWLMLGRRQAEQFLERASGPFGIPNSLAAFLLLLVPACGALTLRRNATAAGRVWWAWITSILAVGLLLTVSRGAWLALAIALVVWPLGVGRWNWKRRAIVVIAVTIALAGVTAIVFQAAPKIQARFARLIDDSGELSRPILWRAAWSLFRESPMVGSGGGSYAVLFERHRPERFIDTPQWAHNDYLNTLSDYGIAGFVLLFGGAGAVYLRGRGLKRDRSPEKRDWLESPAAITGFGIGLGAFALQLLVDFHFKIPALAMAFAVVAALALGRQRTQSADGHRALRRRIGNAVAALVITGAVVPLWSFYQAEALRYAARQSIDAFTITRHWDIADTLRRSESQMRRATTLAPRNGNAWSDLAFTLELQAFAVPALVGELATPAAQAAERAVTLSQAVPEFWIRLGVARDMQQRRGDARVAFEKAVSLAPRSAEGWYYYASHLSRDTNERAIALRAIATCLSLDPGNTAAEALRVKLNDLSRGAVFP